MAKLIKYITSRNKLVHSIVAVSACFSLLLIVAIVFFNRSHGWFSSNYIVNSTGMNIKVEVADADAEYFAYIYDVKLEEVQYTGKDGLTGIAEPRIDNLDMQFHDTIFVQRNRFTPAFIRIRLTNINEKWLDGGNVTITIARDVSIPSYGTNEDLIYLNSYFSSIMRYTLVQDKDWFDETIVDSNNQANELYFNIEDDIYSSVKDRTGNTDSSKTFTTVVTDGGGNITSITKTPTINLKVPYTSSDIQDGHLDVYLYITYDSTLVNQFEHQAGGVYIGTSAVGNITKMENDMAIFAVGFEE